MAVTRNKLSGKRVRLAIGSKATSKEIAQILERVYGIGGCDGCGRNGFDILITHGYPPLDQLKGFDQIQGIEAEEIAAGR
jgi:hypothetical protein